MAFEIQTDQLTRLRLIRMDWNLGGNITLTVGVGQMVNGVFTPFTARMATLDEPDATAMMLMVPDDPLLTCGAHIEQMWLQFLMDRGDFNDLGTLQLVSV
jgi:hypothetical protein